MKIIIYISVISLLIACKNESKAEYPSASNFATECPADSILLEEIATDNLLFSKTYVLVDTIFELIEFRFDTSLEQQNNKIAELIKRDSIPSFNYSKCRNRNDNRWSNYNSFETINNQKLDEIFEDPYIISGKIDNYKVLKEITGKDGFMFVSELYYSPDYKFALVGLEIMCGWRCGQHQIRLYRKKQNRWYLDMNYVTTES